MQIFILKGFIIGLIMAIPIGPMGTMCFSRSVRYGFVSGLVVGCGIAFTDGLYGAISAFGLRTISQFLHTNSLYFKIIAVPFFIYLGYKTLKTKSIKTDSHIKQNSLIKDFLISVLLTVLNPMTIATFLVGFTLIKIDFTQPMAPFFVVLGVILGSLTWWLIVSCAGNTLRDNIKEKNLVLVNKISGWIIIFTSLAFIVDIFVQ